MIEIYKQLISLSNSLGSYQQQKMLDLLDKLSKQTSKTEAMNNSLKGQLNLISPKTYNDNLQKCIDLLKLLGFNEYTTKGIYPEFINWLIEETTLITTYKPKLMNFYLLNSLQQAYMICKVNIEDRNPTYQEVKKCMLTFKDDIKEFEKDLNLSLPELINRIDGTN